MSAVLAGLPSVASAGPAGGQLYAWGENDFWQLGDGTTTNRSTPEPIHGMTNVVQVAGGIAVKADGSVWTWGDNTNGSSATAPAP